MNQQEQESRASGNETAEAILEAAQAVFSEDGYENSTTRQIAERVGISKGLLYYHFKNKEEILFHIAMRGSSHLVETMRGAIAANGASSAPLREKIRGLVGSYASIYTRIRGVNRILFHDIEYLGSNHRAAIKEKQRENVTLLRDYIVELQAKGELRLLDPTVLTFSLISSIHWLFFWFKPGGALSLEEVVDQIVENFLFGASLAAAHR